MKIKKNILLIIGAILVIAQIISFIGLSHGYSLYPENMDYSISGYKNQIERSDLNIVKIIVAVQAGYDRFWVSFSDLFSGNEYSKYAPGSATQILSADMRESLGCKDGGSFGLVVYDVVLTIFYCFVGISGVVLLIIGTKVKRKIEGTDYRNFPETPNSGSSNATSEPSWQRFL